MSQLLMIKYGELGLKGKNKNLFINRLVQNIQQALNASGLPARQVQTTRGRIMVPVLEEAELPARTSGPCFWHLRHLPGAAHHQGIASHPTHRSARFAGKPAKRRRI